MRLSTRLPERHPTPLWPMHWWVIWFWIFLAIQLCLLLPRSSLKAVRLYNCTTFAFTANILSKLTLAFTFRTSRWMGLEMSICRYKCRYTRVSRESNVIVNKPLAAMAIGWERKSTGEYHWPDDTVSCIMTMHRSVDFEIYLKSNGQLST